MSERRPVANNPTTSQVYNFVGQSPHVFAYKVWFNRPDDTEWQTCDCCEGDTRDDVPDSCSLGPLPDGTLIDIPIAIGGKKKSLYKGQIAFVQDGAVVPGGMIPISGRTSEQGGGAQYITVVLV